MDNIFDAKILIVDDEKWLGELILEAFEDEGFKNSLYVDHPTKALEALHKESYDLMLCDVQMPQMNGVELLSQIRNNNSQKPHVFFLTGGGNIDLGRVEEIGISGFIKKPFKIDEVLETCTQELEKM